MSGIIDRAVAYFPLTNPKDWRQVGKAAVHRDAVIGDDAKIKDEAFIRGGIIEGGIIWGGTIRGGTISGGIISGGIISGGIIRGGTIRGGTIRGGIIERGIIRGGIIERGIIRGGIIEGGTILGGSIRGGTIRGGAIRGGTIRKSVICIFGLCDWPATVGRHEQVAIGCECHPAQYWRDHIGEIAEKHGVDEDEQARVLQAVEVVAAWIKANPDAVGPDEPAAEGGGK